MEKDQREKLERHLKQRDAAFSMEIIDPDEPKSLDPIMDMVSFDGKLFIIKGNGLYEFFSAETIDPDRKDPEAQHSYEKVISAGSNLPEIKCILLQTKKVLEASILSPPLKKDDFMRHAMSSAQLASSIGITIDQIVSEYEKALPLCDNIVEAHKGKLSSPALPQIQDLDDRCKSIFLNAKKLIFQSFEILDYVYDVDKPFGTDIEQRIAFYQKNFPEEDIVKVLLDSKEWMFMISGIRNAIEHEKEGFWVKFKNFKKMPGHKFSPPMIEFDLSARIKGHEHTFQPLLDTLITIRRELIEHCLDMVLISAQKSLDQKWGLTVVKDPSKSLTEMPFSVYWQKSPV